MSEPKRQAAITAVYDKLHENKLGAHWLWCVIEKIAAGESEEEAMREYGYYSRADGAESDESAGDLHIAYLAGFADGKKARPAAPTEAKPATQPVCEGCGKTIPEHDALLRCNAEATQQASGERKPYAYAVYFPDQPTEELVHDLDELLDDMTNREHTITELFAALSTPAQQDAVDAERYRELRRGMYWSVVDAIGDHLRDEALDGDIDAAISAKKGG